MTQLNHAHWMTPVDLNYTVGGMLKNPRQWFVMIAPENGLFHFIGIYSLLRSANFILRGYIVRIVYIPHPRLYVVQHSYLIHSLLRQPSKR